MIKREKTQKDFLKLTLLNILQAMECNGAIALFQSFGSKWNLIYGTYIGDGDSKVHSSVRNSILYGPPVYIKR